MHASPGPCMRTNHSVLLLPGPLCARGLVFLVFTVYCGCTFALHIVLGFNGSSPQFVVLRHLGITAFDKSVSGVSDAYICPTHVV